MSIEDRSIVLVNTYGSCYVCRRPTIRVDVDFEAFLCSRICQKILMDDYLIACASDGC